MPSGYLIKMSGGLVSSMVMIELVARLAPGRHRLKKKVGALRAAERV